MATTAFTNSTQGGTQVTVRDFIKEPTLLANTLIAGIMDKFIAETLFRDAGPIPSGILQWREGDPLFMTDVPQVVAEYGEIPVGNAQRGVYQGAFTKRLALAIMISQQLQDRSQIDPVAQKIRQVTNTFVKTYDTMAFALLLSKLSTQGVTTAWTNTAATIRYDIAKGMETVGLGVDQYGSIYGWVPDTIVVHPSRVSAMLYNTDIDRVFTNTPIGDDRPIYSGTVPGSLLGLTILKNQFMDPTKAIILQRGVVGAIGDERKFRVTDLYEDKPREAWRADASRISAMVVDQPTAGVILTGI